MRPSLLIFTILLLVPVLPIVAEEQVMSEAEIAWMSGQSKWSTGDMAGALPHFEKASKLGYAKATLQLGFMYAKAWGVERDYEKARAYWKIGVDNEDSAAILQYANTYLSGLGVQQDIAQALDLFKQSARLGEVNAMSVLGRMYSKGIGDIAQDYFEGYRWHRCAFHAGDASAKDHANACRVKALSTGDQELVKKQLSQIDLEVIDFFKNTVPQTTGKTAAALHYSKMSDVLLRGFMRDGRLDDLERAKLEALKQEIMGTAKPLTEAAILAMTERQLSDKISTLITCGLRGGQLRDEQMKLLISLNDRFALVRQERCPEGMRSLLDTLNTQKKHLLPEIIADKTIDQTEIKNFVKYLQQGQSLLPTPKTKATTRVQIVHNNQSPAKDDRIGAIKSFKRGVVSQVYITPQPGVEFNQGDVLIIKHKGNPLCKARLTRVTAEQTIGEITQKDWQKGVAHLIRVGDGVYRLAEDE